MRHDEPPSEQTDVRTSAPPVAASTRLLRQGEPTRVHALPEFPTGVPMLGENRSLTSTAYPRYEVSTTDVVRPPEYISDTPATDPHAQYSLRSGGMRGAYSLHQQHLYHRQHPGAHCTLPRQAEERHIYDRPASSENMAAQPPRLPPLTFDATYQQTGALGPPTYVVHYLAPPPQHRDGNQLQPLLAHGTPHQGTSHGHQRPYNRDLINPPQSPGIHPYPPRPRVYYQHPNMPNAQGMRPLTQAGYYYHTQHRPEADYRREIPQIASDPKSQYLRTSVAPPTGNQYPSTSNSYRTHPAAASNQLYTDRAHTTAASGSTAQVISEVGPNLRYVIPCSSEQAYLPGILNGPASRIVHPDLGEHAPPGHGIAQPHPHLGAIHVYSHGTDSRHSGVVTPNEVAPLVPYHNPAQQLRVQYQPTSYRQMNDPYGNAMRLPDVYAHPEVVHHYTLPPPIIKKKRLQWTPELHAKFEAAVQEIGLDSAVPKTLLQAMNVPSLTRENVASHLQKYRDMIKKRKKAQLEGESQNSKRGQKRSTTDSYESSQRSSDEKRELRRRKYTEAEQSDGDITRNTRVGKETLGSTWRHYHVRERNTEDPQEPNHVLRRHRQSDARFDDRTSNQNSARSAQKQGVISDRVHEHPNFGAAEKGERLD